MIFAGTRSSRHTLVHGAVVNVLVYKILHAGFALHWAYFWKAFRSSLHRISFGRQLAKFAYCLLKTITTTSTAMTTTITTITTTTTTITTTTTTTTPQYHGLVDNKKEAERQLREEGNCMFEEWPRLMRSGH